MSGIGDRRRAPLQNAVLIAGPTASGKSALALKLAGEVGGFIVNADSMQVYDVLHRLTARPTDEEMALAPHRLYGRVAPSQAYSTGQWLRDVEMLIRDELADAAPSIFVGGTGLYFKALTEGLSEMPQIPAELRAEWRRRLATEGGPVLHRLLTERDPETAGRLSPSDGQRIVRALEVFDASGRSIRDWQGKRGAPLVDAASARKIVIEPEREELERRIEGRLRNMVGDGALEEVRTLLALGLDPSLPAMKAIGVREFGRVIRGEMSTDEALREAKIATRRYAKRQSTWFRNQLDSGWSRVEGGTR